MQLELAGPAGRLEAILDEPDGPPRAAVVFAHPLPTHGGTMHTKAVYQGAKALARIGCAVLRFNFRGVGRSEIDPAGGQDDDPDSRLRQGAREDFRVALDEMAARYPGLPLWTAGFSFGAWVALTAGAEDERVSTLIAIAPPVNRPAYDFSAVRASTKPTFLIHGEADDIVPLQDIWKFYGELQEPKELVVIDAADHLFDGKTSEVGEAIEDLLGDY
jgi:alpha/beta superfamily hydrolase